MERFPPHREFMTRRFRFLSTRSGSTSCVVLLLTCCLAAGAAAEEPREEGSIPSDAYLSGSRGINLAAYDIPDFTKAILLYSTKSAEGDPGKPFLRSLILLKYPEGFGLGEYGSWRTGIQIRHLDRDDGVKIRFDADIDSKKDEIALPSNEMETVTGQAICLHYEEGAWKLTEVKPLRAFLPMLQAIEAEMVRRYERSHRKRFGPPSLHLDAWHQTARWECAFRWEARSCGPASSDEDFPAAVVHGHSRGHRVHRDVPGRLASASPSRSGSGAMAQVGTNPQPDP